MLKVVRAPAAMRRLSEEWRRRGLKVGLVPTMGALHEGHASLVRRAARECGRVAVSIFVNPTQFGPNEDFSRYPRTFAADKALCRAAGAHAIYHPSPEAMYPEGFSTTVSVKGVSEGLCGAFRPGHFAGVATVVLKLLNAAAPDRAYFGEKDYQQLAVIRRMAADLDLPCAIVGCPIVREKDGLALSSRNRYLSAEERRQAVKLSAALRAGAGALKGGASPRAARAAMLKVLRDIPGARIDYAEIVRADTLAPAASADGRLRLLTAVRLGNTRLIDNLPVSC